MSSITINVVEELFLKPRAPVPANFIADKTNRDALVKEKNALVFTYDHPTVPFVQLDILLTENLSFPNLFRDSITVELYEVPLRIVSIEKLLELKKSVDVERPKDIHDTMVLTQLIEKNKS